MTKVIYNGSIIIRATIINNFGYLEIRLIYQIYFHTKNVSHYFLIDF